MRKIEPVNVEDKELWLEINTFQCKYGRFTPETCEKLRARAESLSSAQKIDDRTYLTKPICCKNCKEWKKLAKEVYKKREEYLKKLGIQPVIKKKKKKRYIRIFVCPICNKEKRYYARGLCATCYDKIYRKGRKRKKKKKK